MIKSKKLLVLASTYPRWKDDPEPGFVHELSRRLTDNFEVTVLCPHAKGAEVQERMDGVDVQRYRYAPAAFETLVNNGGINGNLKKSPLKWILVPFFLLSQLIHTWLLIRKLKPDVIHAHWIVPQGLVLSIVCLFTGKVPIVLTSHGADLFTLKGGLMAKVKVWILNQASFVTVVSEPMRKQAISLGVKETSVAVMPMGVDFEKFTPSGEVVRNANEILFVGRLVEKKGLSHLIRALDVVRRKLLNIRLTIIGFGPEEQALKQLAIELCLSENIDFIGAKSQAELLDYYRRAALFVAPFIEARDGDQEGLGLVTIEAAACGCQVLVGKVAAVANLPIHTVDVTDPEKFSAAILSALQITGMDNGFHLRNELESVFSWPRVASGYAELLKKWAL